MKFSQILILIISLSLGLISCSQKKDMQDEIIKKVKTAKAKKAGTIINKHYSGIINEAEEMNLSFRVAGPIQKIHVKEGDYVKKGQLIAQIDSRDYEVQYNAINTQYEQVKSEVKRVTELYNKNSVAPNDYEKAISGKKMLELKLKNAKDQLNDTKLYAPFPGYIQKINYENGELINTGMTIATLIDVSYYEIMVNIPASLFILKENFISFTCEQEMLGQEKLPIELTGFNKKADNNQLYRLYFKLDPKQNKNLSPGMNVKVNISYKSGTNDYIQVPVSAIFYSEKKSCVWVYDEKSSTIKKREVKTEHLTGNGMVSISKGLKDSEIIVAAGTRTIKEGQKVKPVEVDSETNIGGLL